jgi:signal transduction histidine kinase
LQGPGHVTGRLSLRRIHPSIWLLLVTIGLAVVFIGASLYVSHVASKIDSLAQEVASNVEPSIEHLVAARTGFHEIDGILTTSVLDGAPPAQLRQELDIREQIMRQRLDAYAALPFFPAERTRWELLELDLRDAKSQIEALLSKIEAGDMKHARALRAGPVMQALDRADKALADLIEFDAEHGARLAGTIAAARLRAQRAAYTLDALAVVLACALVATAVASTRQHIRAIREAHEADQRLVNKLRAVAASGMAISEALGRGGILRDALHVAAERARDLAGADLVVLGIGEDPSKLFDPIVFAGVEPGLMNLLDSPKPRGVLGVLMAHERTVQIGDVWRDPRLVGISDGHPRVGPFLGVAVRDRTGVIGYLYLGRKPGAAAFSDEDAGAVELLAGFVACEIENAALYASLRSEVRGREDVLSMVSHDLRNPLSAVTMAADVAQRSLEGDLPVRRQLDLIARNANRMDHMIGDLLTAAKLHEGKLTVEPRALDPGPLVREATDAFAAAAARKNLRLGCEIADDLPPVFCDGGRIAQVLSNLLTNAIQFTPEGGSIVVSVHRCPDNEHEVCFSVRDTGVGIPDDMIAHIFERYWQKREHAARGTGLGLFISKGLIEAHNGRIWVTSRPGEGSEFHFALPAAEADALAESTSVGSTAAVEHPGSHTAV